MVREERAAPRQGSLTAGKPMESASKLAVRASQILFWLADKRSARLLRLRSLPAWGSPADNVGRSPLTNR
jgi:hypothetical protein